MLAFRYVMEKAHLTISLMAAFFFGTVKCGVFFFFNLYLISQNNFLPKYLPNSSFEQYRGEMDSTS